MSDKGPAREVCHNRTTELFLWGERKCKFATQEPAHAVFAGYRGHSVLFRCEVQESATCAGALKVLEHRRRAVIGLGIRRRLR